KDCRCALRSQRGGSKASLSITKKKRPEGRLRGFRWKCTPSRAARSSTFPPRSLIGVAHIHSIAERIAVHIAGETERAEVDAPVAVLLVGQVLAPQGHAQRALLAAAERNLAQAYARV